SSPRIDTITADGQESARERGGESIRMGRMSTTTLALATEVGRACEARGWLIATAESCTGGMVAAAITDVAGSSSWFECGVVPYSNEAMGEMLGVRVDTLADHGAVSEAVAAEMAAGALAASSADLSVAVTGIAGPSGATEAKPVGLVCFAWAFSTGRIDTF